MKKSSKQTSSKIQGIFRTANLTGIDYIFENEGKWEIVCNYSNTKQVEKSKKNTSCYYGQELKISINGLFT